MKLHHGILNLLFPRKCVLCRSLLKKEETDLCTPCRQETDRYATPKNSLPFLESRTAVWYYEGNVRSSLLRYKFSNQRSYSRVYGRLLAMKLLEEYPQGFDVLTWIPISPRRLRQRGYDQVELLAQAVSQELEMPLTRTLVKVRDNPPQSGLREAAQRRANVLGAYEALSPEAFSGKRVLLLDDIITTGATASEAARILLTAGAKEVTCAAVAAVSHSQRKT